MELDAINKYLEATQDHLGVQGERYGSGFRVIIANRSITSFLFEMLEGDDTDAAEAQSFLRENPLFPSAWGKTPQEALTKLDAKLALLYQFEPDPGVYKWRVIPRFKLMSQYDAGPGESRDWYPVSWTDIVNDIQSSSPCYYEASKKECNDSVKRDLHALINFKYEGEFARLAQLT